MRSPSCLRYLAPKRGPLLGAKCQVLCQVFLPSLQKLYNLFSGPQVLASTNGLSASIERQPQPLYSSCSMLQPSVAYKKKDMEPGFKSQGALPPIKLPSAGQAGKLSISICLILPLSLSLSLWVTKPSVPNKTKNSHTLAASAGSNSSHGQHTFGPFQAVQVFRELCRSPPAGGLLTWISAQRQQETHHPRKQGWFCRKNVTQLEAQVGC